MSKYTKEEQEIIDRELKLMIHKKAGETNTVIEINASNDTIIKALTILAATVAKTLEMSMEAVLFFILNESKKIGDVEDDEPVSDPENEVKKDLH